MLVLCCFLLAKLAIIKFSLLQVLASLFSRRFLALEKLLFGAQMWRWAIEMCPSYHIALAVTFTDSIQVEISITFCLSNMIGLEEKILKVEGCCSYVYIHGGRKQCTINKRMHSCAMMDFVQFLHLVLIKLFFFGYDSLLLYLLPPYTFFRLSSVVVLIVCKLLHYNNITAHCKLQPEIHTHRCAFPHITFDHGPGRSLLVLSLSLCHSGILRPFSPLLPFGESNNC